MGKARRCKAQSADLRRDPLPPALQINYAAVVLLHLPGGGSLGKHMLFRSLLSAAAAVWLSTSLHAAEDGLQCVEENTGSVSRRICVPTRPGADIMIAPPETAAPVVTSSGQGLDFRLVLPEPPAAVVVISSSDLASIAPPVPGQAAAAAIPPAPATASASPPAADVAPPTMPPEVLQAALKRLKAGKRISDREADDVAAFYEARGFMPIWLDDGRWGQRALEARALFAAAADDGMDPLRYRTVAGFVPVGEPQWAALAAAEAQMTETALVYAREAANGRIRPSAVHPLITPRLLHPSADQVMAEIVKAPDAAAALRAFQPPHPQFARLKAALADARANRPAIAAGEPIPDGPPLRVGMRDPRVPLIRERLGMGYDSTSVYDREVSVRVASLQRANGLPVNGAFTTQTRRVLTGEAPTPQEAEIAANMEFWRWMPRNLGVEHIVVNTPAFEMQVHRGGRIIHQARIIVGKQETQTPFFSSDIDHVVVNPSWYIPPGILKREPKYLDPEYAAAHGYEIRTRGEHTSVRVPPSSSNALGYVKFMFPNDHAVYLHDTPNRSLFSARVRTLSNGCVRVENPMRLAAILFEREGVTEERFRRMQGGGERRMNLPRKMPVHLGYFTMVVGEDGVITRHPDVYGHAARLRQLLGMS
jgi:L,D-transpeptidase YcbB